MRYVSTRSDAPSRPFSDILLAGLAPDGGLYLPEAYPQVDAETLARWRGVLREDGYAALAFEVVSLFVDDIPADDLRGITARAYDPSKFLDQAIVPVSQLSDGMWLAHLSNGPSAAFKDMAMQLLGELFPYELARRGEELKKFVAAAHPLGVTVVEDHYDPQEFYSAVTGLENEPERGSRCTICYRLRMRRAAQYASENGFDWFTTTLSISPHKDAKRINAIGQELEAEFGVKHLPSDFKKHNGYLRSLQLSEEYGLYRQDYCGCEFSAKARGIER